MVLYQTLISLLAAESLCVRGKTGEKKKGKTHISPAPPRFPLRPFFSAFGSLTVATPSLLLHSPSLRTGRELFYAHQTIDIFSICLSKKNRFNSSLFPV